MCSCGGTAGAGKACGAGLVGLVVVMLVPVVPVEPADVRELCEGWKMWSELESRSSCYRENSQNPASTELSMSVEDVVMATQQSWFWFCVWEERCS